MNRILVLLSVFMICIIPCLSFGANERDFAGRWVNVELEPPVFSLYIGTDGEVVSLMPMPQFAAVYRADAGKVVVTATAGPLGAPQGENADFTLMVKGDKLFEGNGKPLLFRFLKSSEGSGSIRGTWRFFEREGTVEFWTFRSDKQLIYEMGFAGEASMSGDILSLNSKEYKLRRKGDTLYLENDSRKVNLTRRPWGCFGNSEIDGEAKECRPRQ